MLLRSLNDSRVYPLWDTTDEKGITCFFQTPEYGIVVYMYWKRKKKKSQGNLVFGETRSYTHQQRFPYRPTCGEGFVYLLKSMKRFHTDHLFFPWHWGDDAQEGCRLVAHWLGSLARGRRRKHSGKIRDLPAAFHQAVWWQDSLFSQSSPVQSESLNVGVRESIPR